MTFDVPSGVTFMNFCFDNSGEKVSQFYVMVDNHGTSGASDVTGSYTVTAEPVCIPLPPQPCTTIFTTANFPGTDQVTVSPGKGPDYSLSDCVFSGRENHIVDQAILLTFDTAKEAKADFAH